jgi:diaminopimelate epimerase
VLRVKTMQGVIEPRLTDDGRVTVNMGAPVFTSAALPFDDAGLALQPMGSWGNWPLALVDTVRTASVLIATVSMGNPHAVLLVDDTETAPVATLGPAVQASPRFAEGVNVGFMQVQSRSEVRLRVYERGVGETLACGSGACAAVVAGIRLGLLDASVEVHTHGGVLTIAWAGATSPGSEAWSPVFMTGPATTVFQGEIELPDSLAAA